MDGFLEQLEVLKRIFQELPTDLVATAIDHLDHAVESMVNSVVYVPDSMDCLVNTGQSVVEDFLHLEAQSPTFYEFPAENPAQELYCFTCGDIFNNRKTLYRHGKAKNHQTRRFKYNREPKKQLPETKPDPRKKLKSPEPVEDFSEYSNILEDETFSEKLENASLTCLECGEMFKNRKALYRHGNRTSHILRLRKAEKSKGGPVRCEECQYTTANESNLRRHMQRTHGEAGSLGK